MQFGQAEARAILRREGRHSLAWSALQPGMEYFARGAGFIPFVRRSGIAVALGDPVAPIDEAEDLLTAFVAAHPRSIFMQTSLRTAALLKTHAFHAVPVGVENEIETDIFTLTGKRKADLRHYRNKASRGGVVVREEPDSAELRARLKPVSDAWLPLKSGHGEELHFLARPFLPEVEPGVRIFTGRIDGEYFGFVILDPMHDQGRVVGYAVTILRHRPDAPEGTVDYINLHVIEALRGEGIPLFSLGVSPFYRLPQLAREHGSGPLAAYTLFHLLYRFGNPIYHFRGLSFHKSRYRASETPVFACFRGSLGLWPLFAASRACGML